MMSNVRSYLFTLIALSICPLLSAAPVQPDKGAEKVRFTEITSLLDSGGNAFAYLDTAAWQGMIEKALNNVEESVTANLPTPDQKEIAKTGFAVTRNLINTLGITKIQGLGLSSIATGKGVFRNRVVLYHDPKMGNIWPMLGTKPVPLNMLKLMPANTVAANFATLDVNRLWKWLNTAPKTLNLPKMQPGVGTIANALRGIGADPEKLFASIDGQGALIVTMNPETHFPFPANGTTLQIPDTGIMWVFKLKDSTLFDLINQRIGQNSPNFQRTNTPELKMISMAIPLPVPIRLVPTIAFSHHYLFLATDKTMVQDALDTLNGKKTGLTATAEFKKLAGKMPKTGNHFHFFSAKMNKEIFALMEQRSHAQNIKPKQRAVLSTMLKNTPRDFAAYGVMENTPHGIVLTQNATHSISNMVLIQATNIPMMLLSSGLLPAITKAQARAQDTACSSHLKQIGMAVLLYAADNNGALPATFLELVQKAYIKDGKVWGCPARPTPGTSALTSDYVYVGAGLTDKAATPASTVIAYDRPGNHPNQVMNVLLLDGHVETVHAPNIETAAEQHGWRIGNR